ncbi:sugar transferase [Verrucomicrobiales bacterium]|nr:sugar transferase [Verrucomicrobiales bacterium]
MKKRLFDIILSGAGLVCFLPILIPTIILIWLQDFRSPFYIAPRMLTPNKKFNMLKLRSMVANADKIGGTSTAQTDMRITLIGHFIRKCKLDEISQLWNVLIGDMSLVGPRPQAERDARLYTKEENKLFNLKPGITDFSSIVFSDEGNILAGSTNPDLKYNQIIRPWKSRLGLFYIDNQKLSVDLQLIYLTVIALFSRSCALTKMVRLLTKLKADPAIIKIASRKDTLVPFPPPGMEEVEIRY